MFQYSTENSEYCQRWNCYVILQICNIRCQKFDPQHESVGCNKWEGFKANSWKKLQEVRDNSITQMTKLWKVFSKISRNDVKICWRGTQIDLPSFPWIRTKAFQTKIEAILQKNRTEQINRKYSCEWSRLRNRELDVGNIQHHHRAVQLSSCHLNGHTWGFHQHSKIRIAFNGWIYKITGNFISLSFQINGDTWEFRPHSKLTTFSTFQW